MTFEIFARAALELLGGQEETPLHMPLGAADARFPPSHRADSFPARPAQRRWREVTPVDWHGSGDVPRLTRANAYLVADPDRAGVCRRENWIRVLSIVNEANSRITTPPAAPRMVDVSAQGGDARARHGPTPSCGSAPRCSRSCRENPKGNPLEIARIAGILAAKRTSRADSAVPSADAHPCRCGGDGGGRRRPHRRTATTTAQTGVEMEALTAAAVAALTVYDMTKALDKSIEIQDVYLLEKTGGKSGDFHAMMQTRAVLTISDSVSAGTRADRSGPAVRERLEQLGWRVVGGGGHAG